MVICLERGADLHMAQLMPLPLAVSCFSKIQTGFAFLVPADPGSPEQRAVEQVCVNVELSCLFVVMYVQEIGQLRRLTELDISENQLVRLPPELGKLVNITDLGLSYNRLEALPDSIGMLLLTFILVIISIPSPAHSFYWILEVKTCSSSKDTEKLFLDIFQQQSLKEFYFIRCLTHIIP